MKVKGVTWEASRRRWWARLKSKEKRFNLGYYLDWFDAVCARKAAENAHQKERFQRTDPFAYPLRDCPHCDKKIPKLSRKGRILKKGHYNKKKTCGDWECIKASQLEKAEPVKFTPSGYMDLFILGRL